MKIKDYVRLGTFCSLLGLVSCTPKSLYKNDGIFEGKSQSIYDKEPFMAISKIHISDGKINRIEFKIIDTTNNEVFDEKYESHYAGNAEYINQCRNDWKGVHTYPERLMKIQNLDSLDAVTGATWSFNMFKSSVSKALEKARRES